ncbi:SdiA-regulated domain-containing protein [Halodesulfovibrio spirochaetisodalis]|uniref:SdiA-regulated domain-containing protein n=1 Tax=Halodesulfovibrio spirochaetisodalis TaxID=1560234 RepID=UPI0009EDB6A9|nr:SdiA-regulated domain-containing protein [Halodesulfovibrio spirochaetisodalis]
MLSKKAIIRLIKSTLLIGLITFCAFFMFLFFELDDKIHSIWMDWKTSETIKEKSIWLPNYIVDVQAKPITGVDKNVSGITFDYDNNTLWIITNQPQELIELDMEMNPIRVISLKNFSDTEAVAYMGDGHLVIADERDFSIVLAPVTPKTTELDRQNLKHITLKKGGTENIGLEGIAIDPETNVIFAVQERNPLKIITISGLADGKRGIEIGTPPNIDVTSLNLRDLSGLHFDSKTGHLLMLSDESKLLVEVSMQENDISYFDLEAGFFGLTDKIPQAEGVTMDADRNLYIVSEPNLIYRFKKSGK